jgi:hypothetical protein
MIQEFSQEHDAIVDVSKVRSNAGLGGGAKNGERRIAGRLDEA